MATADTEIKVPTEEGKTSNDLENEAAGPATASEVETATSTDACKKEEAAIHPLVIATTTVHTCMQQTSRYWYSFSSNK